MRLKKRAPSMASQQQQPQLDGYRKVFWCWRRRYSEPSWPASRKTAERPPSPNPSLGINVSPSPEPQPELQPQRQSQRDDKPALREWEPSQYPRAPARRSSDSSIFTALESVWDTRPISTDTAKTSATFASAQSNAPAPSPKAAKKQAKTRHRHVEANQIPVIQPSPPSKKMAQPAPVRSPKPDLPSRPPPPLSPQEVDDFCCQLVQEPAFVESLRTSRPVNVMQESYEINPREDPELFYPALFHSMAVCDAKISGLPVRQKSHSFHLPHRGVMVGDCQFLNLTHNIADDFAVSMLTGLDQRPQFFLEYKVNIKGPRQKRTAYVLASQMDFTSVVRQVAMHILYCQPRPSLALPAEDGTGACRSALSQALYRAVNRPYQSPYVYISPAPTDWLELAMDVRNLELLDAVGVHTPSSKSPSPLAEIVNSAGARSAFNNLHELLLDIRYLHRDVFLLRPSHTYQNWEIAFTSPSLQTSVEEMGLCLTGSDPDSLHRLGVKLSKRQRCTERVRWGKEERECRLYCVPLDGSTHARDRYWVCWLVASSVPDLWEV